MTFSAAGVALFGRDESRGINFVLISRWEVHSRVRAIAMEFVWACALFVRVSQREVHLRFLFILKKIAACGGLYGWHK